MNDKFDNGIAFCFCSLIFFLPISIALTEIFTALAIILFLVKRLIIFSRGQQKPYEGETLSENKAVRFLQAFRPRDPVLNKPLFVYALICAASILFSYYPDESIVGFLGKVLEAIFIYVAFIEAMGSERRLRYFLTVFLFSTILICVNGIFQYFHMEGFIRHKKVYYGRISSSLRQANDFGSYLVFVIPVWFSMFIAGLNKGVLQFKEAGLRSFSAFIEAVTDGRLIHLCVALLASVCIGLTFSRGAWLALFFSIILLSLNARNFRLYIICGAILFVEIFSYMMISQREFVTLENLLRTDRLYYWKTAMRLISDHLFTGVGINAYSLVVRDFAFPHGGYPHNCYLQMAAEIGIFGLAAFVWIFLRLFRCAYRDLREASAVFPQAVLMGWTAALAGFLFHSFFDTFFYSTQLSTLMWLAIGVIVACRQLKTT